jgi:hypothetical protein
MKKAFHWLFVHPIAFAWILAAIAIVLNWIVGSGAPPKKEHQAATEQHETRAEKHAEKKEAKAEEHAAKEAAKEEKRLDKQEAKDEKHEAKAEKHETKGEKAAQQAAMAAGTAATAVATEQAVATESTTTETASASQDTSQASASVAEQAGNADAATTATASTTTEVNENSSPEDLLLAAREAYWSGEYDRSVSLYQSLLKKDDKPDYKGELANVYWKQGKSTEAVSLYAEIAPWLAEQGRMAELQSIKVYADVVDPTKAAAIAAVIK